MIYLLMSIACSTVIFIVFKLFKQFEVNNLQAIVINYLIAGSLGYALSPNLLPLNEVVNTKWFYGVLLLGFMFIALFQIMAWVSQNLGVAVVSIAVKMSLVIPVLFGLFYYNEGSGFIKISGIILALLAVYLSTKKSEKIKRSNAFLVLPVLLFIGSGTLDLLLKYHQAYLVAPQVQAQFAASIFWVAAALGSVFYLFTFKKQNNPPNVKALMGGIALGIPNYGSIYFLLKALEYKGLESSIVFPINNVGIVVLSALIGAFIFKEKLNTYNKFGILLAIVAITAIAFSI